MTNVYKSLCRCDGRRRQSGPRSRWYADTTSVRDEWRKLNVNESTLLIVKISHLVMDLYNTGSCIQN